MTYEDLPNSDEDLQFKLRQKLEFEEELKKLGIEIEEEPKCVCTMIIILDLLIKNSYYHFNSSLFVSNAEFRKSKN